MTWFLEHWQTVAALGIVGLVALLFIRNLGRPRGGQRCGGGCGCPARPKELIGPR